MLRRLKVVKVRSLSSSRDDGGGVGGGRSLLINVLDENVRAKGFSIGDMGRPRPKIALLRFDSGAGDGMLTNLSVSESNTKPRALSASMTAARERLGIRM